jgi:hypothetical protein
MPGSRSKSKAAGGGARSTLDLTSKQRGELAEMMFMVKAAQKGFATAKPYGAYMVNLQRNANGEVVPYDVSEIDFVVAYVVPCDAWFVIPVEAIYGRQSAKLCLHGNPRSGKLGKYWEAWGLMTMRWVESG